ncbi:putative late blight resistance proteinR1B-14 [Sesamum angolense]|uniref:Late blight resistance proteinR1B-14 n=1 Tax=Sesamum angolense TaxID=2727404 RepID=A0AAE2BYI9_9LAMI|nr:putative late blight resistance proteinR1B-14 [Sesamum angolense]
MFTSLVGSTRPGGDELHQKSIEKLAECLYKNLKGRRYLIVMDDVWDTKAWDDIRSPIFSGQNYDYWAIKMKTYFQSQKLWELVEEGVTLPEDSSTSSSDEKGKLENKKAKDSEALLHPNSSGRSYFSKN